MKKPSKKNHKRLSKNAAEQLQFVQKAVLEDIRELKRYQWQSSYYSILALGALIALYSLVSAPTEDYRSLLKLAVIWVGVAWLTINAVIERSLERSRAFRDALYKYFDWRIHAARVGGASNRQHIFLILALVVLGATTLTYLTISLPLSLKVR